MPSHSEFQAGPGDAKEQMLDVAERELGSALVLQERSHLGMHLRASREADVALGRAVHEVCDEAHRLELRAEEMLVVVKQAWSNLAPVRVRHLGDRDADVLREVVSSSIEAFFERVDRLEN